MGRDAYPYSGRMEPVWRALARIIAPPFMAAVNLTGWWIDRRNRDLNDEED